MEMMKIISTAKAIKKNAELQQRFKEKGKINAGDQMSLLNQLTIAIKHQHNAIEVIVIVTISIIVFLLGFIFGM